VLLQPAFENAFVLHWQSPDGVFSLEIESASLDARTLAEVSPHGAHPLGVDTVFSDTGTAAGTGDEYHTSNGLDRAALSPLGGDQRTSTSVSTVGLGSNSSQVSPSPTRQVSSSSHVMGSMELDSADDQPFTSFAPIMNTYQLGYPVAYAQHASQEEDPAEVMQPPEAQLLVNEFADRAAEDVDSPGDAASFARAQGAVLIPPLGMRYYHHEALKMGVPLDLWEQAEIMCIEGQVCDTYRGSCSRAL